MERNGGSKTFPSLGYLVHKLENGHQETVNKCDELKNVLTKLRYEGRASFGKNLKEIRHAMAFFDNELFHHFQLEENIIFPFLMAHVPKLEPVIHLLESEHIDFRDNFETLVLLLETVKNETSDIQRSQCVHKIAQIGTYLTYLLSTHARNENKSVYQIMVHELKPAEKKELVEKMVAQLCHKRKKQMNRNVKIEDLSS